MHLVHTIINMKNINIKSTYHTAEVVKKLIKYWEKKHRNLKKPLDFE